ncbi:MAG TPA: hypothetical protein VHM25_20915, partial [Polyangiaceae bacterium]|nr:hypothetical protein [Polyangiaceae bacterium]
PLRPNAITAPSAPTRSQPPPPQRDHSHPPEPAGQYENDLTPMRMARALESGMLVLAALRPTRKNSGTRRLVDFDAQRDAPALSAGE